MSHPNNDALKEAQVQWIEENFADHEIITGKDGQLYAAVVLPAHLQWGYEPPTSEEAMAMAHDND